MRQEDEDQPGAIYRAGLKAIVEIDDITVEEAAVRELVRLAERGGNNAFYIVSAAWKLSDECGTEDKH